MIFRFTLVGILDFFCSERFKVVCQGKQCYMKFINKLLKKNIRSRRVCYQMKGVNDEDP